MEPMTIRAALPREAEGIRSLLGFYSNKGALLPRPIEEILDNIRDFSVVIDQQGCVRGCVALRIYDEALAEVRSLAVSEALLRQGLGRKLIKACEEDARKNGIPRVFALTYVPQFFEKLGFERIAKENLPQKIWRDCIRCPHFPDCGEIAVVKSISAEE